jgi:hypothetical protein
MESPGTLFAALRLPFLGLARRLIISDGELPSRRHVMGDKSPKSKQRDSKQKDAAKTKVKTKKDADSAAKKK